MTLYPARSFVLPMLFALPLACNSTNKSAQPGDAASAVASQASAVRPRSMKPGYRAGLVGMMFHGAHDLTLTDTQSAAIDPLEEQLRAVDPDARAGLRAFQADMAAGIKASKIDMTKIQADFAAIDKTAQARQAKEADALNGLHAVLDAAERHTLVASLRARQAAREGQKLPEFSDAGVADWTKRRLDRMTNDLSLDPGQQKQVAALIAKGDHPTPSKMQAARDDAKKRADVMLNAFDQDDFDAKTLDLSPEGMKTPHDANEQEASFVSQLLPILKPDQRERLVNAREKPNGPPLRRPPVEEPVGGGGGGGIADPSGNMQ